MKDDTEKPLVIAITMGDPAGIGPEVILKALREPEISEICIPVVIGSSKVLKECARELEYDCTFITISAASEAVPAPDTINVIEPKNLPDLKTPLKRKANEECGRASYECILTSIELAQTNKVDAVATAPICKESFKLAGISYPGHTEMLAKKTATESYAMMMQGGGIRVVLATIHIPLWKVGTTLSKLNMLSLIELTHSFMKYFGVAQPRIGLCALNPHAGESGMFGDEEARLLKPAVVRARKKDILISDPQPADTLFHNYLEGAHDVVIAMYHDQALIPVKTLDFYGGVNITMGLPFIRTSVDHGTAFDIAGKGIAHPRSMKEALKTAVLLARNKKKLEPGTKKRK